ncbi:MAG: aminotransferase class IV [Spirochaetota bacterium]
MLDYNGELFPDSHPVLSAKDIGFHYGLGLYETFYVKNRKVAFFEEHLKRFYLSTDYFQYKLAGDFSTQLLRRIQRLLDSEEVTDARLRLTFSQGATALLQPDPEKFSSVLSVQKIYSHSRSVRMMLASIRKPYPSIYPPHVKYTSNTYSIYSYMEAIRNGFDEGVLVTQNDLIAEGSFCNLFWVDVHGQLKTPAVSCSILDGVTRSKLLQAAENVGVTIEIGEYHRNDLDTCKELYISSSTRGILPVRQLDGRTFSEEYSLQVQKVSEAYLDLLHKSLEDWQINLTRPG